MLVGGSRRYRCDADVDMGEALCIYNRATMISESATVYSAARQRITESGCGAWAREGLGREAMLRGEGCFGGFKSFTRTLYGRTTRARTQFIAVQ